MEKANTKNSAKEKALAMLNEYIEKNHKRHTPEREAVLNALFDMKGWVTIEQIEKFLTEKKQFPVSRATLYNTLKLLRDLRIAAVHRAADNTTKISALANTAPSIIRICTNCGKTKEIKSKAIDKAVKNLNITRFTAEGFALTIYGMCSTCKAQITKKERARQSRS